MNATPHTLTEALRDYQRLRSRIPLGPLRNRMDYKRATKALDAIVDAIGENASHPLAELAEAISVFVERYEIQRLPAASTTPGDVLRLLMQQHGLRQRDLPEIGSQGVISELLSGRRQPNARQIRLLAARFGVSPTVFLP